MPKNQQANRDELSRDQRRKIVAANILAGVDYRTIAEKLDVSPSTVANDKKAIQKEWQKEYSQTFDEWIQMELARYHVLLNAVWTTARGGTDIPMDKQHQAIDRVLKIMERIEKTIGIDVTKVDHRFIETDHQKWTEDDLAGLSDAQLAEIVNGG